MFPPMLLYVRFGSAERRGVWLPLFMLWLILLPFVALAFAVTIVADVALYLAGGRYHQYTLLLIRCLGLLGALRGTAVRVYSSEHVVDIDLV